MSWKVLDMWIQLKWNGIEEGRNKSVDHQYFHNHLKWNMQIWHDLFKYPKKDLKAIFYISWDLNIDKWFPVKKYIWLPSAMVKWPSHQKVSIWDKSTTHRKLNLKRKEQCMFIRAERLWLGISQSLCCNAFLCNDQFVGIVGVLKLRHDFQVFCFLRGDCCFLPWWSNRDWITFLL